MDAFQAKSVCDLLNEQVFDGEIITPDHLTSIINKAHSPQDIIQHLLYLMPTHGRSHRIYSIIKAFDWDL